MSKLSSLLVDLQVDSAKLRSGLDQANAHLKSFGDKADQAGKKVASALNGTNAQLASFKTAFGNLGAMAAGYVAFDRIASVVSNSVNAFVEAERASNQLGGALAEMGYKAADLLPALQSQADAFEETSLVSAEAVMQVQQLLLRFGVAPKDIQGTTQAILDYSAATGKDAQGATLALLKGVEQGRDGIKGLGIEFDATGDRSEDLGRAVDALSKKWGGAAGAAAEGFGGQLHKLQTSFGNLGESFGEFIAKMESKTGILEKMTQAVKGLSMVLFGDENHERELAAKQKWNAAQEKEIKLREELAAAEKFYQSIAEEEDGKVFKDRQGRDFTKQGASDYYNRLIDEVEKAEAERKAAMHEAGKVEDQNRGVITAGQSEKAKSIASSAASVAVDASAALAKAFEENTEQLRKEAADLQGFLESVDKSIEERARRAGDSAVRKLEQQLERKGQLRTSLDGQLDRQTKPRNDLSVDELVSLQKRSDELIKASEEELAGVKHGFALAASQIGTALLDAANNFVSKLGSFGGLVNGVVQGAANAGVWGAVAAGVMDLFTQFEGFKQLASIGNGIVQSTLATLGGSFTALVTALRPVLGAVGVLVNNVFGMFGPVLETFADAIGSLAPLLMMVGAVLTGLKPAFQALNWVLDGVVWLLEKIIFGTFQTIRAVAWVVLKVIETVGSVWNGIISAIQNVFRSLGSIDIAGWKPLDFLNGWADGLEGAKAKTEGVTEALNSLESLTYKTADAKAEEAASGFEAAGAQEKLADATNKATRQLTNVPSGYKIMGAIFEATSAALSLTGIGGGVRSGSAAQAGILGLPKLASGGIVTRPTVALIGEAGPEAVVPLGRGGGGGGVTINATIVSNDPERIWRELQRVMKRDNFQRHGTPLPIAPRLATR